MGNGVSIIIPTWNGGEVFKQCLSALSKQNFKGEKQVIIIDSGSTDGTCEVALDSGAEVKRIDQKDFHHSRTRNEAVNLAKHSKVVLLVQDAIPISENWLSNLVCALNEEDIVAAYGQQIPHADADIYARFEVEHHAEYLGKESTLQAIVSIEEFRKKSFDDALRTIRFDNVCAIYKKEFLLRTSFPDVPFGEDIAWAYEILKQGYKVKYQPEIKVYHSHNRSPEYRFRRAIIDTIVCSELLEKVRDDLSYFKAEDLYRISLEIKEIVSKIYLEMEQKCDPAQRNSHVQKQTKVIIMKLPYLKRFACLVSGFIRKYVAPKEVKNYALIQALEYHLRYVLSIITVKYNGVSLEDIHLIIDQVAASMQGRIFGEAYVSYKLKGEVPRDIKEMILPHLRGV